LLFWIGLPAFLVTFAARSELPAPVLLPLMLVLNAVAFIGIAVMHRGRKLMAAIGDQILAEDSRPPVVYLRPFAADHLGSGAVSSWPLLKFGYFTDEEQLATVMNELGPFVAIGDPRESLPDLGAARIYVRDGQWQQRVEDLLSNAGLVILRAGTSEGFWWEFQKVRAFVRPERLLLLISSGDSSYDEFRKRAAEILPHLLPDLRGGRGKRLLGHVQAAIVFDANWQAQVLPTVRSFARSSFTAPHVARLKLTLKPIYQRLAVPWSAPPLAIRKLAVLAICGIVGALAALLWLALELPQYL
jgi:hypothetical protein